MLRTIDRLRAARRDNRGFTLIELLIVIIILGVLAAVVVFSVRGITNNAAESACKTEFRTVETAIEAYYADGLGDPANLQDLVDEGFLKAVPTDYVTGLGTNTAGDPIATGVDCTTL
ncbi:prepilin-type N-terminal cleavage/methylation domain-containing protein [Nocardioides sp. GCM10030258]|uniref:prepilin-type N-terminal cleavage/methylation domain-containing protein n=1 Tax=unclassified Nocardioides TaxID=2615069 RepID=UPI00361B111F